MNNDECNKQIQDDMAAVEVQGKSTPAFFINLFIGVPPPGTSSNEERRRRIYLELRQLRHVVLDLTCCSHRCSCRTRTSRYRPMSFRESRGCLLAELDGSRARAYGANRLLSQNASF